MTRNHYSKEVSALLSNDERATGIFRKKPDAMTDVDSSPPTDKTEGRQLVWPNIIGITGIHLLALYFLIFWSASSFVYTWIWGLVVGFGSGFGITAGAHRLWSHRTYKAKWPLRLILLVLYATTGMNSLYQWVRDHRVHHKFSETDADPHNANRGFFFSHVGWLFQKKHPLVLKRGREVDMSDILDDPLIRFYNKFFILFHLVFCFVIPPIIPYYFWGESVRNCVVGIGVLRYVILLNITWLVNSASHLWGYKPYDSRIGPTENKMVAYLTMGEGWHNYHHVFPWDYKAAELGSYWGNTTTLFLDFFAKIGWAYDLKSPSKELVEKVARKYGALSPGHKHHHHLPEVDYEGRPLIHRG